MADKLQPRTAIDRGPTGESPINLEQRRPEVLSEAGGDSNANDIDTNVGGAPASAGLDSGGAVGVRRGVAVGRPGFEYDSSPAGEADDTVMPLEPTEEEEQRKASDLPPWAAR